jgi:hypothetical protein
MEKVERMAIDAVASRMKDKILRMDDEAPQIAAQDLHPEAQESIKSGRSGKTAVFDEIGTANIAGISNLSNMNGRLNIINACGRNKRLNIMVVGAALGLICCLLMLTFYKGDLPGEVVGIISTIAGIFGACLKDAYSFEFGSSRGSKDKDEKLSTAILEKIRF